MKKAKSDYYSSRLTETQDPKTMWRTLKKIMPDKKTADASKNSSLSASKFNHLFTSIAGKLCERSRLSTFIKPQTPRVNKNFSIEEMNERTQRNEESNYRPISVLPLVSKIMEREIQVQLVKFLEANEVLSVYQSGFRKGHSTETAVSYLTDQILEHMDKQQMTGPVFIDRKKAFDLSNHNCLLQKLEHYGIKGKSLTWFQNYLGPRTQGVRFGQDLSSSLLIKYSVPQGSLLGPLLFVIHINDLPSYLKNTHISMYADDTVIYCSGANPKEIKKALQEDLERVVTWMKIDRLVLNKDRTKGMLFGTRQRLETVANFNIIISGINVEMVSKFTYLGVTLDEELKWKAHAEDVHRKVSKRLGLLIRIRSSLTLQAAQVVYKCIIEPIFSYADSA
ncbi:putative RNA-directed DNA polymerase from transposon BS [Stylophora pistillata]|uniref:Putative RNA-directed DNA polymerase from transposon BS n=1 Tax=Stylophora pistillata TaxID=50429 RepID=A0A2B4RDU5_STYPI|nr:putative RNA-directed DNA polymerase from transposon BS [Stylophora pistillata]